MSKAKKAKKKGKRMIADSVERIVQPVADTSVRRIVNVTSADKRLSYGIRKTEKGIFYPEIDPNFDVLPDDAALLDIVNTMSSSAPQNILLTGPQGCGKTEMAVWFAAKYERPCIIMNCATIREAKDWFGYRGAKSGSVYWHSANFVQALETGRCVVIFDEFNRLHTSLHNSLYPLLDARRSTYVEELGEMLVVSRETIFVATCNIGFTHTGTYTIDSAMEDRWGIRVDIDFPNADREVKIISNKTGIEPAAATRLVQFANNIRSKSFGINSTLSRAVSTRQLLHTAQLMIHFQKQGISVKKALEYTIVPYYSKDGGKDSEQSQVLQLIQGIFG